MTYAQLMTAVTAAARAEVGAQGGQVEMAESMEEVQAFMAASPRSWRLVLHWEGLAEHPAARQGMVYHQVATVIQAPRGLMKSPNPLQASPTGTRPFSDYIDLATAFMVALRFPNGTGADSAGFAPAGSQWLETTPNFAAHVLNWKLTAALPPFTRTIPLVFPHL
jgi:hypothetical protein